MIINVELGWILIGVLLALFVEVLYDFLKDIIEKWAKKKGLNPALMKLCVGLAFVAVLGFFITFIVLY